ncbi:hypothetical protein K2Z83_27320 [Oscillochloris sp. ZM17-4]|uniref:ParM/StbA family protein n=1 Tax=Oscillochloris sp. ZM17-4 TaxID=2866714 RepID=UPI001C73CB3B|nr:hypothetical protein [Oscillochloris sp. ZM17-4]MBX0331367.1 hypothetical protein [Oscillochloris sp. ZM17-4]
MYPVGLIVGHGYVKAVAGGRSAIFPAVAAPAGAADYESAVATGARAVRLNGSAWLVGQEALAFAPQRLVSILDRSRYQSPSFVALARHALAQVAPPGGPMAVMTGMPAAWFADGAARAALEGAVRAAGSDWDVFNVSVAPEAAGVFYAAVFAGGALDLTSTRGAVGVIDAGYRDVNVALFHDGRYVSGESVPGGMADALREVRRLISRQYGLELALHEVDAAVRAGGLDLAGVSRPLPEGTEAALLRSLDTVVATGRSLWPNGGRGLRALVLGGGGAVALGPALHAAFPQLSVPGADLRGLAPEQLRAMIAAAQPQLAGARGFAAVAAARQQR